jgi:predicted permease
MSGSWLSDARHAVRSLVRQPGFTAVALVTLAVGIGANTAVFSVVNGVLLRPLPYPDAGRLVMVFRTVPRFGFDRSPSSFPDFSDWRAQAAGVVRLAAYGGTGLTLDTPDGAERLTGARASADLAAVLGVTPALGRWFGPDDDQPGGPAVIVLSHALWRSRFGQDAGVVGRSVTLSGRAYTVVGVARADFQFPSDATQFWVPLQGDASRMERDSNFLTVIGRLGPGVTVERAQAELAALAARIDAEAPGANQGYGLFVEPRHAFVVRQARQALWVFLGAVALVLLIACANVANLVLARGASRSREMAIRAALGAGRGRLARLVLTESAMLGLAGGILGVGVAWAVLRAILTLGRDLVPRLDEVRLDPVMLGFTAAVALGSGLLFGTVGALTAGRARGFEDLREGATFRAGVSRRGRRLQHGFVVLQVALAVTLSLGAGLLVNSFLKLTAVQPGFDPERLVAGRVAPEGDSRAPFLERVLERTAALPGVEAAALVYDLPFGPHGFSGGAVPEERTEDEDQAPAIAGNVVAGDYFSALRIPVRRGRRFEAGDDAAATPVVIVNETLARSFWPGQDPLGRRMRVGGSDEAWLTVIGVVGDVRQRSLWDAAQPGFYLPLAQATWVDGMFVVARSGLPAAGTVRSLREVVRQLDRSVPVTNVSVSAELIAQSVRTPRFRALVLAVFGAAAVVVTVAGVYGVIAFAVNTRRRELAIRVALGAAPAGLVTHVVRGGLRLTLAGVVIGVAGALGLSRFLRTMLFGLTPHDPATIGAVVLALTLVTGAACYLPARRAAAADPLETMRAE